MARVFERYKWLVDLIRRSDGISLEDIQRAWGNSPLNDLGKPLSERTFHRHKEEIEKAFNVTIKCRKYNNEYYIENEEEVEAGGVTDWMLSTIAVDNMLNESRDLRERIQFEKIPGGTCHLSMIINAMRDGTVLKMTYNNFWRDELQEVEIKPYFLKVYEQRWYVVGPVSTHKGDIRTYALDRIVKLEQKKSKFTYPKKFSPEAYFANCYGIFHTDDKPCFVKLRVAKSQSLYMDTLPLHRSQEKIEAEGTESYVTYRYFMSPAYDFVQYLASKAATIEVLEPQSLRDEVARMVKEMYKTYYK